MPTDVIPRVYWDILGDIGRYWDIIHIYIYIYIGLCERG